MRVTNIWKSAQKPTISFELFPARSEKAAESLERVIETFTSLKPDFVSVTFGAGGSTREGSRQLIKKLKQEKGLELVAYFACYGLGPDDIADVLNSYKELGIVNILAVRGDPPQDDNFEPHPDCLPHASDLVSFIRQRYDFSVGVAGHPEGHIESPSKEKYMEYLKYKVDQGAEYIISNYFYDNKYFFDFVEQCRSRGIDVPILPGIMPIYSIKMMEMLARLCGATITDEVRKGIDALDEGDKEALVAFGIEFATRQCVELLEAGVPGIHFYTMDRSKSVVGIINRLRDMDLL
jgi:methylenetetrahydrofolate reductase (NADPH)